MKRSLLTLSALVAMTIAGSMSASAAVYFRASSGGAPLGITSGPTPLSIVGPIVVGGYTITGTQVNMTQNPLVANLFETNITIERTGPDGGNPLVLEFAGDFFTQPGGATDLMTVQSTLSVTWSGGGGTGPVGSTSTLTGYADALNRSLPVAAVGVGGVFLGTATTPSPISITADVPAADSDAATSSAGSWTRAGVNYSLGGIATVTLANIGDSQNLNAIIRVTVVPEPSSVLLFGGVLLGVGGLLRRRFKAAE